MSPSTSIAVRPPGGGAREALRSEEEGIEGEAFGGGKGKPEEEEVNVMCVSSVRGRGSSA